MPDYSPSLAYASRLESSLPWGFSRIAVSYSKEKVILHKQLQTLTHNVPKRFLLRPLAFSHLVGHCMVERVKQEASSHH